MIKLLVIHTCHDCKNIREKDTDFLGQSPYCLHEKAPKQTPYSENGLKDCSIPSWCPLPDSLPTDDALVEELKTIKSEVASMIQKYLVDIHADKVHDHDDYFLASAIMDYLLPIIQRQVAEAKKEVIDEYYKDENGRDCRELCKICKENTKKEERERIIEWGNKHCTDKRHNNKHWPRHLCPYCWNEFVNEALKEQEA